MDLTAYTSTDIFNLPEVSRLSRLSVEQAVILLFDDFKNVLALSGQKFREKSTEAPSLCMIINFINQTKINFKYAIVLHNHPLLPWYDTIIPSREDIGSTQLLRWQLALLGIDLVDHIIISGDRKCSFWDNGFYHNGPIKINSFEIKRFLYCFLLQAAASIKHEASLDEAINLLEKNLDINRDYYEKPFWLRFFNLQPGSNNFKKNLLNLKPRDDLIKQLIYVLVKLEDEKQILLCPKCILPFGFSLQKRIINSLDLNKCFPEVNCLQPAATSH